VALNADGTPFGTQGYKPWGEVKFTEGTMPTEYTFTGQYSYVSSFGMMYFNARWYDSYLNRWAQPDSIIPDQYNPLDWDRYSFVRNNPIRYTDPDGHRPCDEERGCGEPVDEFQLKLGRAFAGEWDTEEQEERQEEIERFLNWGKFILSIISEPIDWAITIADCVEGQCSAWSLLGLLPLLPSSLADDLVDALKKLDGQALPINDVLDLASQYLGKAGYTDMGNGRFLSEDGLRQVRMGDADILGVHGSPHMNFEMFMPDPKNPGRMIPIMNVHILLLELLK
jgi:RHS repeat-associated protein